MRIETATHSFYFKLSEKPHIQNKQID